MAGYDKHQDLEFEFILNSDISIVSEMGRKILKVDYNTNIIAYQNWSIKTKSLNKGERAVFNYSCDKLIKAAKRLENMNKSYEPSVIMSYKNSSDESIHLVFSAENLRYNEDKRDNKLYMLMDVTDKLHSDLIPEDGDFQDVRLNLSTMPYHVLDVKVGSLPRSNNNLELHSSNDNYEIPPFSFLVDTTVSSISTVNGVSQIRLPSSSALYAYEQWSVNHKALEGRKRILKAMTWEEAKENVGEYDSKFQNSAFTPTVFIEINEKQYLGVITGLEIEGSDAVLSVETNSMAMKHGGKSSSLPSLPDSLEEGTKIFMNIDDTPSQELVHLSETLQERDGFIGLKANEVMELRELNNFLSIVTTDKNKNTFVNNGEIFISLMDELKESKDGTSAIPRVNKSILALMRNEDDDGEIIFVNNGHIYIDVFGDVNSDILGQVIYGKGTHQRIHNTGLIYVRDKLTSGEVEKDLTRDIIIQGSNENHFTFINAPVYNEGVIRFDKIINKSPIIVVGIEEVILSKSNNSKKLTVGDDGDEIKPGTILFEKIQSDLDLTKISSNFSIHPKINQTVGIKKVKNLVRSQILFKQIIVGNKDDSKNGFYKGDKLNMSAYGIVCMGDVDGEDFNQADEIYNFNTNGETIDYRLTNPNFDGYGGDLGPPAEDDNEYPNTKETTNTISGVGEGGFIYIDSVENYSRTANRYVAVTAVGVYNLIQTNKTASTFINDIINNGYGGTDACMGITNVLVNYGQIQITNVKNLSKLPFHSFHSLEHNICYGIKNVVQNGYTEILDDDTLKPIPRGHLQRACLPPFPPAHYDINGEPKRLDSYQLLQGFMINSLYQIFSEKIYKDLNFSVEYDPFEATFKHVYTQGHISIGTIVSECIMNELCIGINQYGGWAFNSSITNVSKFMTIGATHNNPISITRFMQRYVKKYTGLSTIWSYPTTNNRTWEGPDDSSSSNLLKSFFTPKPGDDWPTNSEIEQTLKDNGWYWGYDNPVQMYYKYIEGTGGLVSDIIFFPMNWGIVTINYVMAGGFNPVTPDNDDDYDNDVKGCAYGIRKLITTMGPIQIDNIESNIEQEEYDKPLLTLKENTLVNTEERPELTRHFYPPRPDHPNEDVSYMDLPTKYIHGYGVEEVYGQSINDLPILLTIDSADVADVENRVEGIWSTGTSTFNNYCWPYHLINKEETVGNIEFTSHTSLTDEFKFSHESGKTFNVPPTSSAKNLLQLLQSPGSAHGVLRTIDYGSNAPGLGFLKAWTQPIETKPHEGDVWNNARECMGYVSQAEEVVGRDDDSLTDANGQPIGNLYHGTIGPADMKIIPKHIKLPTRAYYNNSLTPQPGDQLQKTEQLHYDIVRKPLGIDNQWIGDYLHYPFKPRLNRLGIDPNTNLPFPGDSGSASFITNQGSFVDNGCYANNNHVILFNGSAEVWRKLPSVYPLWQFEISPDDVTNGVVQFIRGFDTLDGKDFFSRDWGIDKTYVTEVNPWIGVIIEQDYDQFGRQAPPFILDTEVSHGQVRDIVEVPVKMNMVDRVFNKNIYYEFDVSNPKGDSSLYIYNSDYLAEKVILYDYSGIGTTSEMPNMNNHFNGLTPFPLIKNQYIETHAPSFSNLTYSVRTFQDYIPLCEKILWNPSLYKIGNPYAYYKVNTPLVESQLILDKYVEKDIGVNTRHHDSILKNIYPFLLQDEVIVNAKKELGEVYLPESVYNGILKMPNHYNILHSKWPYDEALTQFNGEYFGATNTLLTTVGRNGPLNSTYYTPDTPYLLDMRSPGGYNNNEINKPFTCLANFLSYNYSSTRPVGFNPHLIRGGYWNLEEDKHPNAQDIKNHYGGNPNRSPSFSVVSKGKKYITSLYTFDSNKPIIKKRDGQDNAVMTHEDKFLSKYKTNNRYYGFVYESRNSRAKFDFLSYEMVEGCYTRYKDILQMVSDQNYISAQNAANYTSVLDDSRIEEVAKIKSDRDQRNIRQTSSLWNLGANALLMIGLHLLTRS